jgi:hypothetical protein
MGLRVATPEEQAFFLDAHKRLAEAEKRIKKQTRSKYRIRAYMRAVHDSLAKESFSLFGSPFWD